MNNRGFTLIELLAVLIVIAIVSFVVVNNVSSSWSVGREEAYKLMKNNIVSAAYTYIQECETDIISCDFSFEEQNQFKAIVLQQKGYFTDLNSPIDGKDVSECLLLKANKSDGVVIVDLIDNCY